MTEDRTIDLREDTAPDGVPRHPNPDTRPPALPIIRWSRTRARERAAFKPARIDWAFHLCRVLFVAIVVLSMSNFNPSILGVSEESAIQQQLVLGLWVFLIALTWALRPVRESSPGGGSLLYGAFIAFAMLSFVWASNPASGFSKSAALLLTTFGAWRLRAVLSTDHFFDCTIAGLTILAAASLLLVVFVPSIGILNTWQHAGQWAGIFVTKQNLGTAAALLVLLALVRLMHSRSGATMISLGLGLACVIGSGSRGATIVAVVAVTCILAARKSRGAGALTATLPLILLLISLASIAYLVATGYPHFLLFGSEIDLTERTLIWHYALVHWAERPVLGYGFNGFWTEPDLYFEFLRQHKWVLDNYHSGFVAVLVELGIAGMILLVALTVWICSGVRRVLGPERSSSTSAYAAEAAAGFIVLFVTINLTETFLLRSTNLLQCMFSFLLFGTLADQAVRTAARHAVPTYGWVVSRPPRASGRT